MEFIKAEEAEEARRQLVEDHYEGVCGEDWYVINYKLWSTTSHQLIIMAC